MPNRKLPSSFFQMRHLVITKTELMSLELTNLDQTRFKMHRKVDALYDEFMYAIAQTTK